MRQIKGQISIQDYLKTQVETEKVFELDIRGLCDDPYCPKCGYEFWTEGKRSEVDCERCPNCHIRVNWTRWHRVNDEPW